MTIFEQNVKGVPFDPNFLDHLILIIYLTKVLKKGSSKIGVLTLKPFRPQMSKKTGFFEDFWQNFFIFQKSIFLAKFTRWETKKSQEKNVFLLENTPVYLKQSERQKMEMKGRTVCVILQNRIIFKKNIWLEKSSKKIRLYFN